MKNMKFVILILLPILLQAQDGFHIKHSPFAHTYSIVAWDSSTNEMGVAVQSHYFAVGNIVCWAAPGVGAIATQSMVNPEYGTLGLHLMSMGKKAPEVLRALLTMDAEREVRQVAMVDSKGNVATHTGKNCIPAAGHTSGPHFSAQANLMEKSTVWDAMANAFKATSGPLAERLLAAMEAAQAQGGDIRGKQSAAIRVVSINPTGIFFKDHRVDIRVDDHPEPLKEIRRLLTVSNAYYHMNLGDYNLEQGHVQEAMTEYQKAMQLQPQNIEIQYWYAVTLVNNNRLKEALPLFQNVFHHEKRWIETTRRLIKSGFLPNKPQIINKILKISQ